MSEVFLKAGLPPVFRVIWEDEDGAHDSIGYMRRYDDEGIVLSPDGRGALPRLIIPLCLVRRIERFAYADTLHGLNTGAPA